MARFKIDAYACERCGHSWVARGNREPRLCPHCKSVNWNEPKQETAVTEERRSWMHPKFR